MLKSVMVLLCLLVQSLNHVYADHADGESRREGRSGEGRYWDSRYWEDWYYEQSEGHRLPRTLLLCVRDGQNGYWNSRETWMAIEVTETNTREGRGGRGREDRRQQDITPPRIISRGFPSQEACQNSAGNDRPNFICSASTRYSGRGYYYLQRKNDGEMIGEYFHSQEDCINSLVSTRRRKMCMPTSWNNRYSVISLDDGNTVGDIIFDNASECIESLGNARRGIACVNSQMRRGKYYLFNFRNNLSYDGYFSSRQNCQAAIDGIRRQKICMESGTYRGKAIIVDLQNDQPVGNYYPDLDSCLGSMQGRDNGLICQPSNMYTGKYYPARADDLGPVGDYQYFSNQQECQSVISNSVGRYLCMPSSWNRNRFYIHDVNGTDHLDGYYASLEECQSVLIPTSETRRQTGCEDAGSNPTRRPGRRGQPVSDMLQLLQTAQY